MCLGRVLLVKLCLHYAARPCEGTAGRCCSHHSTGDVEGLCKAPALAVRILDRIKRAGKLWLAQALIHPIVQSAKPASQFRAILSHMLLHSNARTHHLLSAWLSVE